MMINRIREVRAYTVEQLPIKIGCEIGFIGRSNVGKSSLINSLLKIRTAQVSQKPGSTLWLGIHQLESVTLVDLPGYGYAKTGQARGELVSQLVFDYLRLKRIDVIFILIDMRRGTMEIDHQAIDTILRHAGSIRIILVGTKSDKKDAKNSDFEFCCSSLVGTGVDELRNFIINLGAEF